MKHVILHIVAVVALALFLGGCSQAVDLDAARRITPVDEAPPSLTLVFGPSLPALCTQSGWSCTKTYEDGVPVSISLVMEAQVTTPYAGAPNVAPNSLYLRLTDFPVRAGDGRILMGDPEDPTVANAVRYSVYTAQGSIDFRTPGAAGPNDLPMIYCEPSGDKVQLKIAIYNPRSGEPDTFRLVTVLI